MKYDKYSQVPEWKKDLTRKISLFGLSDLRKLAPIGDLGYANGWYWNKGGRDKVQANRKKRSELTFKHEKFE